MMAFGRPAGRSCLPQLLAALPLGLSGGRAEAAKINPSETQITLPNEIQWTTWPGLPPRTGETAALYGGLDKPGPYVVLMKWYPAT